MARVVGGGERCWIVKEALQAKIDEQQYEIRKKAVQVSVEPSDERRSWYKAYFASLRALESLVDAPKFEPDTKALAIYINPSFERLGKLNRRTGKFEWDGTVVETLGTTVQALEAATM